MDARMPVLFVRWRIVAGEPEEYADDEYTGCSAISDPACPDMTIIAEVPVFAKRGGQRLNGRIDLLLTGDRQIHHKRSTKSYPCAYETWEEKRSVMAGSLRPTLQSCNKAAELELEVETWEHVPVVGQLIRIHIEVEFDDSARRR